MRLRRVENVLLVVHTSRSPDNDEWTSYLDLTLAMGRQLGNDLRRGRQLVLTDGGGPDSAQRSEVRKVAGQMHATGMPVAVLSNSTFVRAIVKAFTWFDMNMKVYAPAEILGAVDFLGITPALSRSLWTDLLAMDQELGGVDAVRIAHRAFERR